MIFNLDLNKNNAINPIIFGRLTDGNLRKITVNITNEGEPVDLTDWVIRFEGTTGGQAKVFDVMGVHLLDAENGKFEYTFSKTAFSATGAYRQAYFAIEKDNMRETTNDIKIVVENVADLNAQDAETVVTELNKTITLINERYAELNGRVDGYGDDIAELENWLTSRKAEIEDLIDLANSSFNEKLTEIQEKLDKINQAIEKGSETIAYSYSADGTEGFTAVYPNLNLLNGTKDFSGYWDKSWEWETDGTYKGLTVKKRTNAWGGIYKTFTAPKDGTYTFSAYVKSSGNNANIFRYCFINGQGKDELNNLIGNNFDWTRDSIPVNLKANDTTIFRYEISSGGTDSILWVAGYKYESNSIATPYMPSASEVTNDDYPKYIGYSNKVKTNKVANDYRWFPTIDSHTNDKTNPHAVTAEQVNAYTKTVTFTKTEIQDLLSDAIAQSKLDANPVGSIITTISNTNPSTYIGGTWERFAQGRTMVGVDESDSVTLMQTANKMGGSTNPITEHRHDFAKVGSQQTFTFAWGTGTYATSQVYLNSGSVASGAASSNNLLTRQHADLGGTTNSGNNTDHNNWQPFMTVYMWKRTA